MTGDSPTRFDGSAWRGRRVAGYLLIELVGAGGMAVVYRARDERLGRDVALKLFTGDEAVRARFVEEALAAASVDHPHIIPIYAAGEADGLQFIAMRFVVGHDLEKLIHNKGVLTPERTVAYMSPVASALDAAHVVGLVHRDVKPANILVYVVPGIAEHVYLSDFGVARRPTSAGLTAPGTFLGTPEYCAPEQASGRPVDGRADQYALACVAFKALTGSVPFKREDPLQVLFAHVYDAPPRLTEVRPGLPPAADAVFARALAKKPHDRYGSCTAFVDALRLALGTQPYERQWPGEGLPTASTSPLPAATRMLTAPELQAPAPSAPSSSDQPTERERAPVELSARIPIWSLIATADHAYFESIAVLDSADAASISFPEHVPTRRFPLTGTEACIGRRSASQGNPEIDLTGPPADPGVSRRHAKLTSAPDGTWSITDLGTANGIQVNGAAVPSGGTVQLNPGDRIHLGAWTQLTILRD